MTDFITIGRSFATGDFTAAAPHLADDIRWNILGSDAIVGKGDVLEVAKMAQLASYPVITIGHVIAQGDLVVIESSGEATTKTGQPYHQRYCEVFRFEHGKLREITTYLDTALANAVDEGEGG